MTAAAAAPARRGVRRRRSPAAARGDRRAARRAAPFPSRAEDAVAARVAAAVREQLADAERAGHGADQGHPRVVRRPAARDRPDDRRRSSTTRRSSRASSAPRAPPVPTPAPGRRGSALNAARPAPEDYTVKLELDATDGLEKGGPLTTALGISPRLAAIEMLMQPVGSSLLGGLAGALTGGLLGGGGATIPAGRLPLVLFIWGPARITPVRLKSLTDPRDRVRRAAEPDPRHRRPRLHRAAHDRPGDGRHDREGGRDVLPGRARGQGRARAATAPGDGLTWRLPTPPPATPACRRSRSSPPTARLACCGAPRVVARAAGARRLHRAGRRPPRPAGPHRRRRLHALVAARRRQPVRRRDARSSSRARRSTCPMPDTPLLDRDRRRSRCRRGPRAAARDPGRGVVRRGRRGSRSSPRVEPGADGEWTSLLDPLLTPQTPVAVEVTRGDVDATASTASRPRRPGSSTPQASSQLTVKAVDRTLELDLEEKIVAWPGTSESAIAEAIFVVLRPRERRSRRRRPAPTPTSTSLIQRATDLGVPAGARRRSGATPSTSRPRRPRRRALPPARSARRPAGRARARVRRRRAARAGAGAAHRRRSASRRRGSPRSRTRAQTADSAGRRRGAGRALARRRRRRCCSRRTTSTGEVEPLAAAARARPPLGLRRQPDRRGRHRRRRA